MTVGKHIILGTITFFAWGLFYLLGIPSNYFADWTNAEKILLSLITIFSIVPFIAVFTLYFLGSPYFRTSIWFAFYTSVLIFLLDYIAVGLIYGSGLYFLISHWPSTLGYFYVWLVTPFVGKVLEKIFTDKSLSIS